MKKLFLIIAILAMSFTACNLGSNGECTDCDSTCVDSTCIDSLAIDSVKIDTIRYEQCHAITLKGTRCERLCDKPDTLCFQHKKMQ